jgi:DNA recombination protein RmuC
MAVIIILAITIVAAIALAAWLFNSNSNLRTRLSELAIEKVKLEEQMVGKERECQHSIEIAQAECRRAIESTEAECRRSVEAVEAERQRALKAAEEERERIVQAAGEEHKRQLEESELRFKNLAGEILGSTQRTFKEQQEARLTEILTPLRENIEQFKRTVTESYSQEARERFSLQERIKELIELNQNIGREAKELSVALRGETKTQGDWGEMILETILEKSGMQRDREFTVQATRNPDGTLIRNEDGSPLRPDVIVNYPDGRCVVIDSKVSLTAYVNYVNADNPDDQERYAQQHIRSVRDHIAELRDKKYQDYVGSGKTDFVMMFIPNEGAYIAAMQIEPTLWQEAYDHRVLIISPTHLISVLKLISQLWNHDRQTRNAIEIATESGKMYDKFVGFAEDMLAIEKALTQARTAYDKAFSKLSTGSGNLTNRAEKLRRMGAKAAKQIPAQLRDKQSDEPDEES